MVDGWFVLFALGSHARDSDAGWLGAGMATAAGMVVAGLVLRGYGAMGP